MSNRTDEELLAGLRALLAESAVMLELDARRLGGTDSPVALQAESNRWLLAMMAIIGTAGWFRGWMGALLAISACIVVWIFVARRDLARRLRQRVEMLALRDVLVFRKLWRHGGIVLRATDGARCAAPDGNWMQFVRDRHPAM
jgi:hypothetical protein